MSKGLRQFRKGSLCIAGAIALAGLVGASFTAGATGATPGADGAANPTYCIAEADSSPSTAPAQETCYPTFATAISAATGGRVQLANATGARYVSPSELSPGAGLLLSIDFSGSDYSGSVLGWYQSSGCGYYLANGMPAGWNDQVRSVITENGCANTLYWNGSYGSPTYFINVDSGVADLGSFDGQTSSEKWCPTYGCL